MPFTITARWTETYHESGEKHCNWDVLDITRDGFASAGRGSLTQGAWSGPVHWVQATEKLRRMAGMVTDKRGWVVVEVNGVVVWDSCPKRLGSRLYPVVPADESKHTQASRMLSAYLAAGEEVALHALSDYLQESTGLFLLQPAEAKS